MLRPVIAGVDNSPESHAAAAWAAEEALLRDVPLRLVQVWQWFESTVSALPAAEAGRDAAERALRDVEAQLRRAHPGLEIAVVQADGPPDAVLTEAAGDAELVALGSRGLGGVAGFLVGSVGLAVASHAERPVVLVRAASEPAAEGTGEGAGRDGGQGRTPRAAETGGVPVTDGRGHRHGEVVLGLDLGHPSDPVTDFAFRAAALRGTVLRALATWNFPPMYGFASEPLDPELLAELEAEARRSLAETLRPWQEKFPGVTLVEDLAEGRAAPPLVAAAARAGLLVVGRRRRRSRFGTRLGPVAHAVLHHAPCPVAVVPHD